VLTPEAECRLEQAVLRLFTEDAAQSASTAAKLAAVLAERPGGGGRGARRGLPAAARVAVAARLRVSPRMALP